MVKFHEISSLPCRPVPHYALHHHHEQHLAFVQSAHPTHPPAINVIAHSCRLVQTQESGLDLRPAPLSPAMPLGLVLLQSVLFYHPAVWWVSGQIRAERELCCDDLAVSINGDALTYARALTQLESYQPVLRWLPAADR